MLIGWIALFICNAVHTFDSSEQDILLATACRGLGIYAVLAVSNGNRLHIAWILCNRISVEPADIISQSVV